MCVSICPISYYADLNTNTCKQCDQSCKTCNGNSNSNCLSCSLPLYFDSATSKCVSNCNQNQYKSDSSASCLNCHPTCETCNGPLNSQCLSCPSKTYLYQKQCFTTCPSGYYQNNQTNQCQQCDSSCLTCFNGSSKNCLTCASPRYFQHVSNSCNLTCNSNQYPNNSDFTCQSCDQSCASCSGPSSDQCQSCSENKFFYQNKCLSSCPDGFYKSSTDNTCAQCNKSCSTCSSISSCSSCLSPFILFNNQCLSECPQGYYFSKISNQCESCSKSCQTCSGPDENQCITCIQGTNLQGTICLSTCLDGYYQNNSLCIKCNSSCLTCTGPNQDQCETCQKNQFQFKNQCLNECPSGTYLEKDNKNKCQLCNSQCTSNCSGPSVQECSNIKPLSQIIVYILISKTVLWVFSSIIGLVKDKNNKEGQNLRVTPSSQISIGKWDQYGNESPIIQKKQSLFSNENNQNEDQSQKQGNQIIASSIQNIQNDQFQNQISNQNLPNFENHDFTSNQQAIQQTITCKKYNRRRPRKIHLILQQNLKNSSVFGVNGFYNYANSTIQTATENNIKEKSQIYDQQATVQNISPLSKSKISILDKEKDPIKYEANQKLKFSLLGNEWVELFSFYDPFLNRAVRATLIYLKYHMYIYLCELFKFSPLYFLLLLSLACGLGLKFVLIKSLFYITKYIKFGNLLSFTFFILAITADLWFWLIPKISRNNHKTDMSWSSQYLITFAVDFLIFQQVLALLKYLSTINFLNNNNNILKFLNIFKSNYILNKIKT
ncbi:zinc finger lsd1 subclass family protein (macronuclear) [Tetrahymena thermophila SB210]|uniref:Zinc finger lsd1 subclass family protein n=1 Tax=Tetrahymena thermophila (strain SB210) TaxID=312017 RepID=Q22RJ5_TETTS|nr:zinc finger lsd1 subclass family protein [Tetrahymena thermophila SB210]EAR88127.3 zinc finger lsd1 subclass family protein [Tetrahymena thermophila SB210]|eukprot:XP_001008372.3 zinc finger lsd1 subclass family protein [Tetrahymena thermophila SB210]